MSDSDDDRPISELFKKRKREEALKAKEASEKKEKKQATEKAVSAPKQQSKPSGGTSRSNGSSAGSVAADFYYDTKKGFLCQKFLVRWWYAMEWPSKEDLGQPPAGYESLDGFSGVYISTRVDSLGHIVDLRNPDTCPCLRNVSRWTSAKLKEMTIKAFENQIKVLSEEKGEEKAIRTLQSELREVKAVDPDSADKLAAKYKF